MLDLYLSVVVSFAESPPLSMISYVHFPPDELLVIELPHLCLEQFYYSLCSWVFLSNRLLSYKADELKDVHHLYPSNSRVQLAGGSGL